jgi:hypothetical protein
MTKAGGFGCQNYNIRGVLAVAGKPQRWLSIKL